jgi:uncharacterized membrane protein HdeD (DUF308 family)
MNGMLNLTALLIEERSMLRRNWGWFVALGVLFTLLGIAGLVFVGLATLVTVVFVGWFFLIAGVAEVVHAIARKGWSGFWLDLIVGLVTAVAGVFILMHPVQGATTLTAVVGVVFLVGGTFRLAAGIGTRNPYAGWFVLHGVISLLLGVMILAGWPYSSVWVLGTLVSIDLLFDGLRLISFGFAVRSLPTVGGDAERSPSPIPPAPAPPG